MSPALRSRRSPLRNRMLGLALGLATLTPSTASAWHDDGHRIVGEIAERRLSAQTRARVNELLADTPGYDTLATAATWADQVAKLDPTLEFEFVNHFVNVERHVTPRELLRLCLEKAGCVAIGVSYYADILRSERASNQQKAEALRFLAHFVGDAHQPLHAGHAADRGGNDIDGLSLLEYTPGKDRTNLHAVWDGGLMAITMMRAGWDWQRYAQELDARIHVDDIARWDRGSVYDWIEESRLLAAGDAYLHADGCTPIRRGDVLGEDYYERNIEVVELRLEQAGIRLAVVLEEILGDPG